MTFCVLAVASMCVCRCEMDACCLYFIETMKMIPCSWAFGFVTVSNSLLALQVVSLVSVFRGAARVACWVATSRRPGSLSCFLCLNVST